MWLLWIARARLELEKAMAVGEMSRPRVEMAENLGLRVRRE